jgi:hypothetical protein
MESTDSQMKPEPARSLEAVEANEGRSIWSIMAGLF